MGAIGFTNPRDVFPPYGFLHSFLAQAVFSARLAVDTFLLLSAFLLTLGAMKRLHVLSLKNLKSSKKNKAPAYSKVASQSIGEDTTQTSSMPPAHTWIPLFFINRYLRIVPLYAACLFFWWQIAPMLGSGPFW
jgi:peptidoglycan/LPS O-acetylase OafA/YrhL